ncbi:MAG TPA: hypothetical protein PL133_07490 [Methylophilaceae bacterium]|nr:hypothetical protein [Methylophilaceae bacterium]
MMKKTLVISVLTSGLLLAASSGFAADEVTTQEQAKVQNQVEEQVQVKDQVQKKERIYGSQLMTPQERVEHRKKLRSAKTAEERERIRAEHHEAMKIRAQERGVTLPDAPPERGMGMGTGSGARLRDGSGPSGGSGQNRGR